MYGFKLSIRRIQAFKITKDMQLERAVILSQFKKAHLKIRC